jgi:hypothetical protein
MFLVDDKLSRTRQLSDGRIAYWRGPETPASILTREQLEYVERMNGVRWLVPYAFLIPSAVLVFLYFKGQMPLAVPALFGVLAMGASIYAILTATMSIRETLDRAPCEGNVPQGISVSAKFQLHWQRQSRFHLRIGTWLTGFLLCSSAFGLVAKLSGVESFDRDGRFGSLQLLIMTVISGLLFAAFAVEVRRRRRSSR